MQCALDGLGGHEQLTGRQVQCFGQHDGQQCRTRQWCEQQLPQRLRLPRGLRTQRFDEACTMADTEHDGAQCVSSLSCCATGNRRVYVLSHAWTLENACGEWSVKKSYAVGNPPLYAVANSYSQPE